MKTLLDILLFPFGAFLEAFVGILYPAEGARMRKYRSIATFSLVGCLAMFGGAVPVSWIPSSSVAAAPLIIAGLLLMFAFLVAGKACADEGEKRRSNRSSDGKVRERC